MKSIWLIVTCYAGLLMLLGSLAGCGSDIALVEQKCTRCHGMEESYTKQRTAAEWQRVVTGMKAMGLQITQAEEEKIVKALHAEYGR